MTGSLLSEPFGKQIEDQQDFATLRPSTEPPNPTPNSSDSISFSSGTPFRGILSVSEVLKESSCHAAVSRGYRCC